MAELDGRYDLLLARTIGNEALILGSQMRMRHILRDAPRAAASRIRAAFAAAYDDEIALGRPEYDAHRNVIEKFRAAAAAKDGASTGKPAGAP